MVVADKLDTENTRAKPRGPKPWVQEGAVSRLSTRSVAQDPPIALSSERTSTVLLPHIIERRIQNCVIRKAFFDTRDGRLLVFWAGDGDAIRSSVANVSHML